MIPKPISIRLRRDAAMDFVWIPEGEFLMGSRGEFEQEEPRHLVRITQGFYKGKYPVTQAHFAAWRPEHENHFPGCPDHPAENLTWHEAARFCLWLNSALTDSLRGELHADLPSEAQWEYACRAGTETEYYTGDGEAALSEAGWFNTNSTQPVGGKAANDFGLHDMHGNLREWCRDWWDADAYRERADGVEDPDTTTAKGAHSGVPLRVVRGGSWYFTAGRCRSACRYWRAPGERYWVQGFRVCLFPGPAPQTEQPEAEPGRGDGARRQAAAESERAGEAGGTGTRPGGDA